MREVFVENSLIIVIVVPAVIIPILVMPLQAVDVIPIK